MASRKFSLLLLYICFINSLNGLSLSRNDNGIKADLKRVLNCLFGSKECEKQAPSRRNNHPRSSIIYLNGIIYTVDKTKDDWDTNPQQAVVIENGLIVFVGSDAVAETYYDPEVSVVYDLHGAVVLPGIHDVHMHPLETMSPIAGDCMLTNMLRPDDEIVIKELTECRSGISATGWVLGAGHSITPMIEFIRDGNSPREFLDWFINDKPAAILEETSHSAWVNSLALERAKITSKTAERPAGVIMREPNSSKPNGILFENEAIDIFELAMSPDRKTAGILELNYEGLLDAIDELAKNGITSVCDARLFWKIKHDKAWEKACTNELLTARAILGLWAYPNEKDDIQIPKLKKMYSDRPNDWCSLRKTQIKVYMDGIVESTTAAMYEKYRVNLTLPIISKKNVGMNYFDKKRLKKYLIALQDFGDGQGFDFHIHAIGDRGIREALDAIEEAKRSLKPTSRKPRHRLTHLEILDADDIGRFAELGVIADFQVAGEFTLPSAHKELEKFVGKHKADVSIPVKSVVDTGAVTTFSSDWDVSELSPFVGIQHAAQRGDQSVSVKTAIEMYTYNPAFAMRQEDKVGAIRAGLEADLIFIDQDILNIRIDKINSSKVLETVFMGESVYHKRNSKIKDVTWSYYNAYYHYYYYNY